jgi:hypothetical protein
VDNKTGVVIELRGTRGAGEVVSLSGISSIATNPLLRINPQSSVMLHLTRKA